jgi:hypothetical protein
VTRLSLRVDRGTAELLKRARTAASALWGRTVTTADITAYCWTEAIGEPFIFASVPESAFTYVRAAVPDGHPADTLRLRSALRWALPELVGDLEGDDPQIVESIHER